MRDNFLGETAVEIHFPFHSVYEYSGHYSSHRPYLAILIVIVVIWFSDEL